MLNKWNQQEAELASFFRFVFMNIKTRFKKTKRNSIFYSLCKILWVILMILMTKSIIILMNNPIILIKMLFLYRNLWRYRCRDQDNSYNYTILSYTTMTHSILDKYIVPIMCSLKYRGSLDHLLAFVKSWTKIFLWSSKRYSFKIFKPSTSWRDDLFCSWDLWMDDGTLE